MIKTQGTLHTVKLLEKETHTTVIYIFYACMSAVHRSAFQLNGKQSIALILPYKYNKSSIIILHCGIAPYQIKPKSWKLEPLQYAVVNIVVTLIEQSG